MTTLPSLLLAAKAREDGCREALRVALDRMEMNGTHFASKEKK